MNKEDSNDVEEAPVWFDVCRSGVRLPHRDTSHDLIKIILDDSLVIGDSR
jgi:hypothetical protein